jgi:transposase
MKRIPFVAHLTHGEIGRRYRSCGDAAAKTRWQVVWLLSRPADPPAPAEVAAVVGLSADWVRKLLKKWNDKGPDALADRRAGNGNKPLLSPEQQAEMYAALQGVPPDGGLWTSTKVQAFAAERFGVKVTAKTGWKWLRKFGFVLRVPRPKHPDSASPEEQRRWLRRPRRNGRGPTEGQPRQDGGGVGRG